MRTRGSVPGMRSSPRYSLYNPRSIARWESEAGDRYVELLKDKGKYRYTGSVPPAPLRDYEYSEEAIGAVRKGPVRVLGHFGHKMRRVYNNRKRPGPKAYRRGFALGRFGGDIAPGLEDYPVIRRHGRAYSAGYDRGLAQYMIATEPRRRVRYNRRNRGGKRWIKGAIKRPGALRRKLAAGYVPGYRLGAGRIPESILAKAYAVARRKGDTQTMRQINFARTMLKFRRKAKATRRVYARKVAN